MEFRWHKVVAYLVCRVGSSRAPSKASLSSGAKMPPESEDNDSMAEYGEGEAGKFFYSIFFIVYRHLPLFC